MADGDSKAGRVRFRTFQEIAADAMELPLVKARTEELEAKKRQEMKEQEEGPLGAWPEEQRGCPNVVLVVSRKISPLEPRAPS